MYIYQIERELLRRAIVKHRKSLGGKILDVGSGPEEKYEYIMREPYEYVTMDINPDFRPDIVGSADAIPTQDKSFDSIICTQVLGDLLYPDIAIKEFARVLKPGGRLLVTEGFMNELHGEPRDFWRFTPHGMKCLLENAGFKVLDVSMSGGPFTTILQIKTRFIINSLSLYEHEIAGKIFSKFFHILGMLAKFLDKIFDGKSSRKIGLNVISLAELIKKDE